MGNHLSIWSFSRILWTSDISDRFRSFCLTLWISTVTSLWQILVLPFDIVNHHSDVPLVDFGPSVWHCELLQLCLSGGFQSFSQTLWTATAMSLWWILVLLFDIVNFYSDVSLADFVNPNLSFRHCEPLQQCLNGGYKIFLSDMAIFCGDIFLVIILSINSFWLTFDHALCDDHSLVELGRVTMLAYADLGIHEA